MNKIGVIGLGKIGLPIFLKISQYYKNLVGIDINEDVISKLSNNDIPFIDGSEDKLSKLLLKSNNNNDVRFSNDYSYLSDVDIVLVTIPLLLNNDKEVNFTSIDTLVDQLVKHLKDDSLLIFETTIPVGTIRDRVLSKFLLAGFNLSNFSLGYSPERVYSGRVLEDLLAYPKIIGGIDSRSTERMYKFYSSILNFSEEMIKHFNGNTIIKMNNTEEAEMVKLAETTYRDVNIALANQYAYFSQFHNINVYSVISACNTQPFSHIHKPGISVGGHCIPVYPYMYTEKDTNAELVTVAREFNDFIPHVCLNYIEEKFNNDLSNKKIGIFGITYREGVKELYNTGAFVLIDRLIEVRADIYVHDPLFTDNEIKRLGFTPYSKSIELDILIIHTAHKEYKYIKETNFPGLKLLFDGRNITDPKLWLNVNRSVYGIGEDKDNYRPL